MLLRIVRMSFRPETVKDFLSIFDESAARIRSFPGCRHLELWQDMAEPSAFTTYSHWENEDALDTYRRSELFTSTWARTKVLFSDAPRVNSYRLIRPHSGPETP